MFNEILEIVLNIESLAHQTAELALTEAMIETVVDVDESWSLKALSSPAPQHVKRLNGVSHPMIQNGSHDTSITTSSTTTASTASLTGSHTTVNSETKASTAASLGADDWSNSPWLPAFSMMMSVDPKVFANELTKLQWEVLGDLRVSQQLIRG